MKSLPAAKDRLIRPIFFLLFFLSGIAGLIYESIWSHYLKLFLGHAAYAQTLVLAIYMGGMALGAWLAGRNLHRTRHLLIRYAFIELLLGVAALFFHPLFVAYQNFSYDTILPHLAAPALVRSYQWLSSALLITPQSMLLGATFPYMAAGFIRRYPGSSGHTIAGLYFSNTLGAALGVLICGFILMDAIGLNGTIATAGIIDCFVGISIIALSRISSAKKHTTGESSAHTVPPATDSIRTEIIRRQVVPLLIISGLTAASSFMYEIGWIRMLSLVLGSSTHSFELMLSAFILGMALGSLFIRKRIDSIADIPRALVFAQVAMGIGALLSLFTYGKMFHLMAFLMNSLARNDHGYFFFNLSGDLICMLVMLPPTLCAGMVLPLIIHLFYRSGKGETAIGKIYGINTFGGIVGIVVSVWLLMPYTGVRFLIILGGAIDIAIGIYILFSFGNAARSRLVVAIPVVSAIVLGSTLFLGTIDPALAASGVFRNGTIAENISIRSHRDGRTATISLYRNFHNLVLCTNGKPDAAINVEGGIGGDEYTMALTGVLPLAVAKPGSQAAVIGMGSGMTAHFLLFDTALAGVDIIEIEPAMVAAARTIGPKTEKAFTDPRAHIYIDDAKSFFATRKKTYDIIVSEPSNPWVSGVSGLFSEEFFERIRHHLSTDGILVQWFHRYESDLTIVASILKALEQYFPHYRIYCAGSDFIIVATEKNAAVLEPNRNLFNYPHLALQLRNMGFVAMDDFAALQFASEKATRLLVECSDAPPNSDFRPYVDLNAVKYRFIDNDIPQLDTLREYVIPLLKIVEADTALLDIALRDTLPRLYNFSKIDEAKKIYREMTTGVSSHDSVAWDVASTTLLLDYASLAPGKTDLDIYFRYIIELLEKTTPYLSAGEMSSLWNVVEMKTSAMRLSDNDRIWMHWFRALCNYNLGTLRDLSLDLLPSEGWIPDDYVNRMLLTALLVSSVSIEEKNRAKTVFSRFSGHAQPGIVLDFVCRMTQQR